MEPLVDKLARQKPVRLFFEVVETCDELSDRLVCKIKGRRSLFRILSLSFVAMIAVLGLFLWLALWDDDMPNDPPASIFEKAFSWICLVFMWPFVVLSLIMKSDPPAILCLPLWVITGLFWGVVGEWLYKANSRLKSTRGNKFLRVFLRWSLAQSAVFAFGCVWWFYSRASYILAHPDNPENYGSYGHSWSFQALAFFLSRLIPVTFGFCVLLLMEWFGLQLFLRQKR